MKTIPISQIEQISVKGHNFKPCEIAEIYICSDEVEIKTIDGDDFIFSGIPGAIMRVETSGR